MQRTYDDTMFVDTFEHEYTWGQGFLRNVRRFAERVAVIDPETGRQWTYSELNREANKLANALADIGIGKNDVVMIAMRNCPEFAFAYTGVRKIGAILLMANFNLASGEMSLLINHNKPRAIIYSANIADMIVKATENFSDIKMVLADNIENVPVPGGDALCGHTSYEKFVAAASDGEPVVNFRAHIYDEVVRLCTSGTTSLPKSVPLNDINEVLSAHDVIMQYPLSSRDVSLNMTPWFHRGGVYCGGPNPSFYVGSAVVVLRKFQPKTVLSWVKKYGITFLTGSPSTLEMLAKNQEHDSFDVSCLRGIVTMGAPLSKSDCERYMKVLTSNIFNGYGTTETFWNSFLRPYDLPDGAGSVGSSCIDDEVRVVNVYDDKKAEPCDTVPNDSKTQGEIIIKAPAKTTYAYFNNDEMMREKFYKGWMYTGDIGTWNEKDIVTVCGRKDDMMVVAGENIYPSQIEEVINTHPLVKDSIVTCVKDKVRGQAVVAYVVPSDEHLSVENLFSFCNESAMLSQYKRPRFFAIVKDIPYTATGKKQHYLMKQRAEKDLEDGLLKRN